MLLTAGVSSAKYFLRHLSRKNSVTQTRRNISQHYDLVSTSICVFLFVWSLHLIQRGAQYHLNINILPFIEKELGA
jgi:glycopeptide antibiotics resistance protein